MSDDKFSQRGNPLGNWLVARLGDGDSARALHDRPCLAFSMRCRAQGRPLRQLAFVGRSPGIGLPLGSNVPFLHNLTPLNRFVKLVAVNRNFLRGVDTEPHSVTPNFDHHHDDVLADDDGFVLLAS